MPDKNPLVEVFGYPADEFTTEARRYRREKLCPFHNKVPECTKDKKSNPLGACDVRSDGEPVITCPKRLTEDWLIVKDAAEFFFEAGAEYHVLREYRMKDANGEVVGNVDIVLVEIDQLGNITDFGAIEVQAVYVSGNMRNPFEHYIEDPEDRSGFNWRSHIDTGGDYPTPDWRSSHKRLFRQLNSKGSVFRDLGKKQAVVIQEQFYDSMPDLSKVDPNDAELVWLVYDLIQDSSTGRYTLTKTDTLFTTLESTLDELEYFVSPDSDSEIRAALERKLSRETDSPSFTV